MWDKAMLGLAVVVADAFQFAGRHDSPAFVLDFLHWLCRVLDPLKVPPDCINPAMPAGISRASGIPIEKFWGEQEDGLTGD
jgi:hypothetical protein